MTTFRGAVDTLIGFSAEERLGTKAERIGTSAVRRVDVARNLIRECLHPSHAIFNAYHRLRVDVFGMTGQYVRQVAAIRELEAYYVLILGPPPSLVRPSSSSSMSSQSSFSPSSLSSHVVNATSFTTSSETKVVPGKGGFKPVPTLHYHHISALCVLTAALFRVGTVDSLVESQQCSSRALQYESIRAGTRRIEYDELMASHEHITAALNKVRLATATTTTGAYPSTSSSSSLPAPQATSSPSTSSGPVTSSAPSSSTASSSLDMSSASPGVSVLRHRANASETFSTTLPPR